MELTDCLSILKFSKCSACSCNHQNISTTCSFFPLTSEMQS